LKENNQEETLKMKANLKGKEKVECAMSISFTLLVNAMSVRAYSSYIQSSLSLALERRAEDPKIGNLTSSPSLSPKRQGTQTKPKRR